MGRRRRRDGREVDLGSPERLAQRRAGPVLPMRFETDTNLAAMSAAPTPSRRIPAPDFAAWLGVAPFFVFAAMFLIAPTAGLLVGAFQDHEGAFTLGNTMRLNQPSIRLSYWLSLQVSAASAALGALLGLALALAALKGGLPLWLRPTLMTFSGVASNFAGVPLAFAFMATLGRLGLVTMLLRNVGLDLYARGFNILTFWGLTITYLYFQIPLMVLVVTPAIDGLKSEWVEAAEMLGASSWQYWRLLALPLGGLYFVAPLIATFEFSLRMRRGVYSFDAYRAVFASGNFQASFLYSTLVALVTIVVAALIVVPAAYFVQLRLPRLRAIVEFITLLPLVIPAIVLVFGYIRLYGSSSVLPLTATSLGADALLTFGYVGLGLPYMYRSVDAGLRAIDVRTLTEAAESQGAGAVTILFHVILPNIRSAILSGAFLTFAIVIGEFTFASLLDRPAFGPYLQLIGASRAYEPAALAVMAFALTWACLGLMQLVGGAPAAGARR